MREDVVRSVATAGSLRLGVLFVTTLLLLPAATHAQSGDEGVRLGPARLLSSNFAAKPMVEPHIAAHPAEPDWLLAAAMVGEPAADWESMRSTLRCIVFATRDGGATWVEQDMGVHTCYDPWLAFAGDGAAAFSVLGTHAAHEYQPESLLVFSSPDGGDTWRDVPVSLGWAHDRPMMVAAAAGGQRAGWLYLVSSRTIHGEFGASREAVFIARSRTGGRTFDEPRVLTPINLVLRAEPPVVLRDESLVVQYVEAGYASPGPRPQLLFDRRRTWTAQSHDAGVTFSAPRFVTEACGPPRFATAAMVAHGSPERLSHFCNAAGGGAVLVTTSIPGGELWTAAAPVHAALPEGHGALIRAAAANADGTLGVLYSTRHQRGEERCYSVFFVASRDGAVTWSAPRPLGDVHCPSAARNGATVNSWPDGGDYYGITADASGRFHAVWPDARSGVFQIFVTTIDVSH